MTYLCQSHPEDPSREDGPVALFPDCTTLGDNAVHGHGYWDVAGAGVSSFQVVNEFINDLGPINISTGWNTGPSPAR